MKEKDFSKLVDSLNHKVTLIERDIRWMKKIGYYMAVIMTGILVRSFV